MEEKRPKCEIGVMCRDTPENEIEVVGEAQIAGDLWVPVCRDCAAGLTYLRKKALAEGNGGTSKDDDDEESDSDEE